MEGEKGRERERESFTMRIRSAGISLLVSGVLKFSKRGLQGQVCRSPGAHFIQGFHQFQEPECGLQLYHLPPVMNELVDGGLMLWEGEGGGKIDGKYIFMEKDRGFALCS